MLAVDKAPARPLRRRVCAERSYDEVPTGPRAGAVLAYQEQSRLLFNVRAFRQDYAADVAANDSPSGDQRTLAAFTSVAKRLSDADVRDVDTVAIKSGFYVATNRRYHPRHFWPSAAPNKDAAYLVDDIERFCRCWDPYVLWTGLR